MTLPHSLWATPPMDWRKSETLITTCKKSLSEFNYRLLHQTQLTHFYFRKFRGQYQIAGFFSFRKPTLLILDADVARQVFLTDFNKFSYNDFGDSIDKDIDPILGSNPFFLNGHEWKERRGDITPAFTVSRVSAIALVICLELIKQNVQIV